MGRGKHGMNHNKPALADVVRVQKQIAAETQDVDAIASQVVAPTQEAFRAYSCAALSGLVALVGTGSISRKSLRWCLEVGRDMLREEGIFLHEESLR